MVQDIFCLATWYFQNLSTSGQGLSIAICHSPHSSIVYYIILFQVKFPILGFTDLKCSPISVNQACPLWLTEILTRAKLPLAIFLTGASTCTLSTPYLYILFMWLLWNQGLTEIFKGSLVLYKWLGKHSVIISVGCYNKVSWIRELINKFISHSSGNWKSKIYRAAWWVSGEISLSVCKLPTCSCILVWQRAERGSRLSHT